MEFLTQKPENSNSMHFPIMVHFSNTHIFGEPIRHSWQFKLKSDVF